MKLLLIAICLFCGYKVFSNRGQSRFDWFICSMLLLSSAITVISNPRMPFHRFLILCYWLSILKNKENHGLAFPLKIPLFLYSIGLLALSTQAWQLSIFYKVYKPLVFLLDSYLLLLMTLYGIKHESFKSKAIVYTLLFVTIYGVFVYLTHSNPIQQMVTSAIGKRFSNSYYFGTRIRVASTWSHPISYGLICSALFYQYFPYWKEKLTKLLLFLLVLNIFICGSRTALAAFLLMGVVYAMLRYKINKSIKRFTFACLFLVPVYLFVPFVHDKIDSVIDTALGSDDLNGSSLSMREEQTSYAMAYVAEAPLCGHGIDWIKEGLGYGSDNFQGDWQLLGFESYLYILLIERGWIGFILELFVWLSILIYAFRNRERDRVHSSSLIALLLGFIFFAISTGTLDSKIPLMFMIGYALSYLSRSKRCLCMTNGIIRNSDNGDKVQMQ